MVLKRLVFYTKDIFDSCEYKELKNDLNIVSCNMRRLKKKAHVEMKDEYGADIDTFYIGDPNFWNTNPKKFKYYKFAVKLKYFNGTTNMIKGIR